MKTIRTPKRPPTLRRATTKVSNRRTRCTQCNSKLGGLQRLFCSSLCKSRAHTTNCYSNQQKRGWDRKRQLVKLKGGKCSKCSYNRSTRALCFHHVDPTTKSFGLDIRNLSNHSHKRILKELEKCILLCANCHMEVHDVSSPLLYQLS